MSRVKDTKLYSINDFLNWNARDELQISPKYQRNPVWNDKAKSYLIDTIIRGLPIPQIYMRQIIDVKARVTKREIIDGQQRLRSIIEFVDNKFAIQKSHNQEYGGLKYSDLTDDVKEEFLSYGLAVEVINLKDDAKIYDMFARLNTNSMTLNKQELRNAKYWGEFKVFVYRLAADWRSFFIDKKTFSNKDLSRMIDIEFISSLVIQLIDGVVQESPTSLDNYYKKYDEEFEHADEVELKLNRILEIIEKAFENELFSSVWFHRKNYFYTLFSVVNHQVYGIEGSSLSRKATFSDRNIDDNIIDFVRGIMNFESDYERFMDEELFDPDKMQKLIKFEQHHRTRTTSTRERNERISILNDAILEVLDE